MRGMRKLTIKLPKTSYTPREEIQGSIELVCDKPFNSKGTTISIQGVLQVTGEASPEVQPKDKIIIETKTAGQALLAEKILLSPPKRYDSGTHKFDFSFQLPSSVYNVGNTLEISSGLIPSYDGKHASVEYSIQALVEVSRFRDVKSKIPLSIFIPVKRTDKESKLFVVEKGEKIVEFETFTPVFCLGSPYELRYRLNSYPLISKVRFEIIHKESTRVEYATKSHSRSLTKVDVRPRKQDINKWQTLKLNPRLSTPQSFESKLITSETVLKVRVELTDLTKKDTTLRLIAGHCSVKKARSEEPTNFCPQCKEELGDFSGIIRPDGSVICPKCFKRFIP
jgi:hypothetical protein